MCWIFGLWTIIDYFLIAIYGCLDSSMHSRCAVNGNPNMLSISVARAPDHGHTETWKLWGLRYQCRLMKGGSGPLENVEILQSQKPCLECGHSLMASSWEWSMPVFGEWDSNNNDCSLKPDGVQPDLREADGPHYMNLFWSIYLFSAVCILIIGFIGLSFWRVNSSDSARRFFYFMCHHSALHW